MQAELFLQSQQWLRAVSPDNSDTASTSLACKTRFHICLDEQHGSPASWRGPLAAGAVNVKLQQPGDGGSSTPRATLDASITWCPAAAVPPGLCISWHGCTYAVDAQQLVKVVCSAAVAGASPCQQSGDCLLATVGGAQQQPQYEWACLVTKHVCLDILVPDSQEATSHLARLVAALHASTCAAASSSTTGRTPAAAPGPAQPTDVQAYLSAASCEAQMIAMLLSNNSSSNSAGPANTAQQQLQEQHLLNAVGHLHASHQGCLWTA